MRLILFSSIIVSMALLLFAQDKGRGGQAAGGAGFGEVDFVECFAVGGGLVDLFDFAVSELGLNRLLNQRRKIDPGRHISGANR